MRNPARRPKWQWIVAVAFGLLVAAGAVLGGVLFQRHRRHLAAHREAARAAAEAASTCTPTCSPWQTCIRSRCANPPDDAHLPNLDVVAETDIGRDAEDVVIVGERAFVATAAGVEIHAGGMVTVVVGARSADALLRVGDRVYATAGQRIAVVDTSTDRLMAQMNLHGEVGRPVVVPGAERVLAPVEGHHEVAVLYPPLHGILPALPFDADIGAVAVSDDGTRAIAVSGRRSRVIRHFGYFSIRTNQTREVGTTAYAFEPSRTSFQADHVRLETGGHPWAAAFLRSGDALVALRGENAVLQVRWTADGVVIGERKPTCSEPSALTRMPRSDAVLVQCERAVALASATGDEIGVWQLPGDVTSAQPSIDGSAIYVGHDLLDENERVVGGALTSIDVATSNRESQTLDETPAALAAFDDGKTLAVVVGRKLLFVGAPRTGANSGPADGAGGTSTAVGLDRRTMIEVGGQPSSIQMGGDPLRVFVGLGRRGEVAVLDPETGSEVARLRSHGPADSVHIVHGRWLTAHAYWNSYTLSVWDLNDLRSDGPAPEPHLLSIGTNVGDVAELTDGESILVTAVQSHDLKRFRLTSYEETGAVHLPRAGGTLVPVVVNGRPQAAIMGGIVNINTVTGHSTPAGAWVEVLDLDAEPFGSRRRALSAGNQPLLPGVTADRTTMLFPDRMSNQVTRLDLNSVETPRTIGVGRNPERVLVMPGDAYALSIEGGSSTVSVLRLDPFERVETIPVEFAPLAGCVSSGGGFVAVALSGSGYPPSGHGVVLLEGAPPRVIARGDTGQGPIDVAASPDGRFVATADYASGTVTLFVLESRAPAR